MDTDGVLGMLQEVAAEVITPRFGHLDPEDVASKAHRFDLVTVADREAEVAITARLRSLFPDAVVVGEESVAADPRLLAGVGAPHAFTVDPVDGTRHFVAGSPDHAVMLAELRAGEVVRSWIWQPQHGRAFVAERGAGAYADGVRLAPPSSRPGRLLTLTASGIDYPRLAEGSARLGVFPKTKPWDHAPGSLLLTEAGGRVGSPSGRPYSPGTWTGRVLVAHRG
ncbi:inositol monophosphatase [Nocardioides sp. GY 10127]|uniref:inositol monophosphatase family protein n=1 Tax=Nocardioides sp. GY 10127 TaxID=2569762 RepID=UPI0010A944A3|nr:inositol monophosphatase [Nocardioides sp. GY 10127]TIC83955.1 inositol monophosphatase [Nocardioides sp. GY 10127]